MNRPPATRIEEFIGRLRGGERFALARAITLVETGAATAVTVLNAIQSGVGNARVIGFTGAPGVGKSTLINAYIRVLRQRGQTVAVAAVDPSSPISGGAILGDRVRMGEHGGDDGVFIRSISSRGHLGGLSATTAQVVDLMDAAGWDRVVIETVGTGQSEVEIARLADVSVVVCAPGFGDDIQAIKAGILEIADVLVVNKADQAFAEQTCQQLKSMLGLRTAACDAVPVLATVATTGQDVDRLASAIDARYREHPSDHHTRETRRTRALIVHAVCREMHRRLADEHGDKLDDLCVRVSCGELNVDDAVGVLLAALDRS